MLWAYLDESYRSDIYLIGAVVVNAQQKWAINLGLDDVMLKTHRAHGVPQDLELHGQQLFQRSEDWRCLSERPKAAFATYRHALERIQVSGARVFIRGVRPQRLVARYGARARPPHEVVLTHLLERVNDYARARGEQVTIVADEVNDQAHHEARMAAFQTIGTPGYRTSKLDQIVMPFQWQSSAEHRCLQAADLVTFVYLRKRFWKEKHVRVAAQVQKLRDAIAPAIEHDWIWVP